MTKLISRVFPIIAFLLCLIVSCSDRETEKIVEAEALPNDCEISASLLGEDAVKSYLDSAECMNDTTIYWADSYYYEWEAQLAEERYNRIFWILILSLACLCFWFFAFITLYINRKTKIEAQEAKIKVLQMELQLNAGQRTDALERIKNDKFIRELKLDSTRSAGLSVTEWQEIELLFNTNLPHFVPALRKLVDMSDFELQVCFLLKLDFLPSQIAVLTNHSAASVSATRSRLYYKAYHKKGASSDWDVLVTSI